MLYLSSPVYHFMALKHPTWLAECLGYTESTWQVIEMVNRRQKLLHLAHFLQNTFQLIKISEIDPDHPGTFLIRSNLDVGTERV